MRIFVYRKRDKTRLSGPDKPGASYEILKKKMPQPIAIGQGIEERETKEVPPPKQVQRYFFISFLPSSFDMFLNTRKYLDY